MAGGTENMSQAPHVLRGARSGTRYGLDLKLEDSLAHGLVDSYPEPTPMGITAENLAKKYSLTRQEIDEYAAESQARWAAGNIFFEGSSKSWIFRRRNLRCRFKRTKRARNIQC